MMENVTCAEILEEYEQDRFGFRETLVTLVELVSVGDVEVNLRALPLPWRKEVELYIFDRYDNETPAGEYFWIGRGDSGQEELTRMIHALRAWIATKRVSRAFARGGLNA